MAFELNTGAAAAALTGTEKIPVSQGGSARAATVSQIVALATTSDTETILDTIGGALVAGTGVSIVVDDAGDTITISSPGAGITAEDVRDTIGAALVAGTGVTITVNDGSDTITIAASGGGGLTAEDVRDTIGAALVAGSGITITVNDPGDTITLAAAAFADNAVTYAKMQDTTAASVLIGRGSASAGDPQEITLGKGLLMSSTAISVGFPNIVFIDTYLASSRTPGTTDDRSAFTSAIAALKALRVNSSGAYSGLGKIIVPPGLYYVSSDIIHDDGALTIEGFSMGEDSGQVTYIKVAASKGFIQFYKAGDTRNPNGTSTTSADGSALIGLTIVSMGGTGSHDGVFAGCHGFHIDRCTVQGFARDGVSFNGQASSSHGNINNWRVGTLSVISNGRDGFRAEGDDANAGHANFINATNNGGYGVNEMSGIGNHYGTIHSAGNTSGTRLYGASNRSTVSWMYSESNEPAPTTVGSLGSFKGGIADLGMLGSNQYVDPTGYMGHDQGFQSHYSTNLTTMGGVNGFAYWADSVKFPAGMIWGINGNDMRWAYSGADAYEVMRVTGPSTGHHLGANHLLFPHLAVGFQGGDTHRIITSDSAAPTTGAWTRGDVVFNNAPSGGGSMGWMCTTGGSPGTWKAMPNLAP